MEKLPPVAKIYEAFSAIADNRIKMEEKKAFVKSSDNSREYTVTWDNDLYTSNDNASYWQGYAGYPMIAVLMLQGKLSLNQEIADFFAGINWNHLNARYKARYDKAIEEVLSGLESKGIDTRKVKEEVSKVYDELANLSINTQRSSIKIIK